MTKFSDLLEEMRNTRPGGGGYHHTTAEVNTLVRNKLVESALGAIRHYKNTSPKYIIGKMSVTFGGPEEMRYYEGVQGNAKILTELLMEGVLALNSDGQLYIIKE